MPGKKSKKDAQMNSETHLEVYEKKLDEYIYKINNGYKHKDLKKSKSVINEMVKSSKKIIKEIKQCKKIRNDITDKTGSKLDEMINNKKKAISQ